MIYQKKPLHGAFGVSTTLYARGKATGHIAWELQADGQGTFEPGLSGSPVFCETGECVAMVALKQGAAGAIAVSIEVVCDVWLTRPNEILPNREEELAAIPRRDPRMNRDDEVDAFARIVSGRDWETKILVIQGPSGMGKTQLLTEYIEIAKRHNFEAEYRTLGQQIKIESILLMIEKHFGGRSKFKDFYSYRSQPRGPSVTDKEHSRLLVTHFFADLSAVESTTTLLLLIDEYEKGDEPLREWLSEYFLPEIPTGLPLVAIVAGQREPDLPYGEKWVKRFTLQRLSFECWAEHLHQQGIRRPAEILKLMYEKCEGLPLGLSYCSYVLGIESR